MTFRVLYRGKSGVQESVVIEAESRPQLFAELQKRGISAIRVEEATGKVKKAKPSTPSARKPSPLRGLLAGLLVISLAVAAWFYLLPTLEHVKAKKDKKPALIAEVAPEIAEPTPVEEEPPAEPVAPAPQPAPTSSRNVHVARSAHAGIVMTLMDGSVITNSTSPIFKRDFENTLFVVSRPGSMSGGLVRALRVKYTDDQIISMLKELTLPGPDDPPNVVKAKTTVQALKEDFLLALGDGYSVSDVLDSIVDQSLTNGRLRADAMKIRGEAFKSDDPELAVAAIEAANMVLENNGVQRMSIPTQLKNLAEEQQAAENPNGIEGETAEYDENF